MDYKKNGSIEIAEEIQIWDFEDFDNGPVVESEIIKLGTLEQFNEHIAKCLKAKFGD